MMMDKDLIPAIEWVAGPDTGTSSKAIWAVMMGVKGGKSCPGDAGDLGRCIRLLDRMPAWRNRMSEMANVSVYWAALADHWPCLERLFNDEPESVYSEMRRILEPIEARDQNIVNLGDGVSIRFGP